MAVDAMLEEPPLHGLDEVQLDLDLLAARNGNGRAHKLDALPIVLRVDLDTRAQARIGLEDALVDEDEAAMAALRLPPRQSVGEHGIGGVEKRRGEDDGAARDA